MRVSLVRKPGSRSVGLWLAGAVSGVLVSCAGVMGWLAVRRAPERPPRVAYLTTIPGVKSGPSFSPDGTQVAFGWRGGTGARINIYVKSIGPGEPRQLTTDGGFAPEWSADGRWIAFLRPLGDDMHGVLLVPPTGGAERTVTRVRISANGLEPSIAWSPDSHELVVPESPDPKGPVSLTVIAVPSGERRRLTFPPDGYRGDLSAAWSPDGRMIAAARYKDFKDCDLYVFPAAKGSTSGAGIRQLTFSGLPRGGLAWTPDGHELVYATARGPRRDLWRVAISGARAPEPLSYIESPSADPDIARQGRRLAFVREFREAGLWRLELSGNRLGAPAVPTRFAASALDSLAAVFSPDSGRVAFASNRSGTQEIWLSRSDGTGVVQLTSIGDASWPQWSPDGHDILFESAVAGQSQIYRVSAAGGDARPLTSDKFHSCSPAWSRDGKWIYFSSDRVEGFQIWKMAAAGGEPIRLTRHGGRSAKESPDGSLVYFTKDHEMESDLWRIPVGGGDEIRVAGPVWLRGFEPVVDGVYYLTPARPGTGSAIEFIAKERSAPVRVKVLGATAQQGLTVSHDRKALLYSAQLEQRTDLMLVENFR